MVVLTVCGGKHGPRLPRFAALRTLYAGFCSMITAGPSAKPGIGRARSLSWRSLSPELLSARRSLARLLLQDERRHSRKRSSTPHPIRSKDHSRPSFCAIASPQTRGFVVEAEAALSAAQKLGPSACPVLEHVADFRREQQDDRSALKAAQELTACNPIQIVLPMRSTTVDGSKKRSANTNDCSSLNPTAQPGCVICRGSGWPVAISGRRPARCSSCELFAAQHPVYTDLANLYVRAWPA